MNSQEAVKVDQKLISNVKNVGVGQTKVEYANLFRRRLTSVLEITAVVLIGYLLAGIIILSLGIGIGAEGLLPTGDNPDWIKAAIDITISVSIQYSIVLGLAYLIGKYHRNRSLREYGITTNNRSVSNLSKIAIIAFAFASIPILVMKFLREIIGNTSEFFRLPFTQDLASTGNLFQLDFLIFLAAGDLILVVICEELLFRGYIQTRLAEDFGHPAAIIMTGLVFAFSHVQYFFFGFFGIGNIIVSLFFMFTLGYLYYKTKSLLPGMFLHFLINLPYRGYTILLILIISISISFFYRKTIYKHLKEMWTKLKDMPSKMSILFFGIYFIVFALAVGFQITIVFIIGILTFPIALFLIYKDHKYAKLNKITPSVDRKTIIEHPIS
ncbi:MAG: lysostaphin resistance A-like protein [Promethearchaeota archaeon]